MCCVCLVVGVFCFFVVKCVGWCVRLLGVSGCKCVCCFVLVVKCVGWCCCVLGVLVCRCVLFVSVRTCVWVVCLCVWCVGL